MRLKHPMLKKSATLLAALLVTGGGFLTFTPESGKAAGTRIVFVRQNGPYVANLCIKNVSKNNIETCTGKVGAGATRALTIPYDEGDKIIFIDAVRYGHNSFYGPLADRDTHCWSDGESLRPKTYCRMPSEAPF